MSALTESIAQIAAQRKVELELELDDLEREQAAAEKSAHAEIDRDARKKKQLATTNLVAVYIIKRRRAIAKHGGECAIPQSQSAPPHTYIPRYARSDM